MKAGGKQSHLVSCCFLAWFIIRPWRWRQHVPLNCQSTFNRLRSIISLKIEFFMLCIVWTHLIFAVTCNVEFSRFVIVVVEVQTLKLKLWLHLVTWDLPSKAILKGSSVFNCNSIVWSYNYYSLFQFLSHLLQYKHLCLLKSLIPCNMQIHMGKAPVSAKTRVIYRKKGKLGWSCPCAYWGIRELHSFLSTIIHGGEWLSSFSHIILGYPWT
jgi:hypothetical protein